jgi:hypothetical protein
MARWRKRVRLEDGPKLDLNRLIREGFAKQGEKRRRYICWTLTSTGETVAAGDVETELRADGDGWLTLKLGELDQRIKLRGAPRRFGGFQWYFLCPATWRPVSVLWFPPGAKRFQSRQTWGRQVAYGSQFDTPSDRAFSRAEEIRNRLGGRDFVAPDGSAPPKPKGMHWRTYGALLECCEAYELKCDLYLVGLAARLKKQGI